MSAESSSTKHQQGDDGSMSFVLSVLKFITIILLAGAIFLFSQVGVLIATGVISRVIGLTDGEREAILAETSYGPKLLVFVAITAVMVMLVLYVTRAIWFSAEKLHVQWQKTLEFLALQRPRFRIEHVVEVFGAYGVYFLVTVVVSVLVSASGLLDVTQSQQLGIAQPSTFYDLGAIFVMLVVLPPIGEEILFRGFLFRALSRYGSVVLSYIVTSILFGFAHAEFGGDGGITWSAVIDTMVFSVFLIYIMRRHQSVYSAMLLHGLKNGVAFLILFGVNWL